VSDDGRTQPDSLRGSATGRKKEKKIYTPGQPLLPSPGDRGGKKKKACLHESRVPTLLFINKIDRQGTESGEGKKKPGRCTLSRGAEVVTEGEGGKETNPCWPPMSTVKPCDVLRCWGKRGKKEGA